MKLVLAAKSLPLKGINRTMKRLLFPLLAALALPTAVNAEPIPKISDYELLSTKGERFVASKINFFTVGSHGD